MLYMRPDMLTVTPYSWERRTFNTSSTWTTTDIPLDRSHKNKISMHARRKIIKALVWLLASADEKVLYSQKTQRFHKFKITFCTLTLPVQGNKSDTDIKKILNSWLMNAKHEFGLNNYIWRAELQKRGVIHFHITSDCFMHWQRVRFTWNRLLAKHGIIERGGNPNSTDIHSVKKIKDIKRYLIKYFTKNGKDEREIKGRLWGCSRELSNITSPNILLLREQLSYFYDYIRKLGAAEGTGDFAVNYFLPKNFWSKFDNGREKSIYLQQLKKLRSKSQMFMTECYTV